MRTNSKAPVRAGAGAHLAQHNVANVKPSSARYRMFFKLPDGSLRLYRTGDVSHPARRGKTHPKAGDLPVECGHLLDWYESVYLSKAIEVPPADDPLMALAGTGEGMWPGGGDAFIRAERDEARWMPRAQLSKLEQLWSRVVAAQGGVFHTYKGLPVTYEVQGDVIRFFREGRRINKTAARSQFEKAVARIPLSGPGELKDLLDYPYLFALLTDSRIIDVADKAA